MLVIHHKKVIKMSKDKFEVTNHGGGGRRGHHGENCPQRDKILLSFSKFLTETENLHSFSLRTIFYYN